MPAVPPPALPTIPAQAGVSTAPTVQAEPAAPSPGEIITVHTDVLDVEINTLGGDLQRVRLPLYPVEQGPARRAGRTAQPGH